MKHKFKEFKYDQPSILITTEKSFIERLLAMLKNPFNYLFNGKYEL
jgi:hypothetical protein